MKRKSNLITHDPVWDTAALMFVFFLINAALALDCFGGTRNRRSPYGIALTVLYLTVWCLLLFFSRKKRIALRLCIGFWAFSLLCFLLILKINGNHFDLLGLLSAALKKAGLHPIPAVLQLPVFLFLFAPPFVCTTPLYGGFLRGEASVACAFGLVVSCGFLAAALLLSLRARQKGKLLRSPRKAPETPETRRAPLFPTAPPPPR